MKCLEKNLNTILDLSSEYFIHIPSSYKLNSMTLKTSTRQNFIVTEVIEVNERLYATETLDDLLLKVVDATMKHFFTEAGTEVIYSCLGNSTNLKRGEVAEKPEVFSAGLERLLGSGAPVIEILILKNLYRKLGLKFEAKKGYAFSDYVKELRKRCGC
jgi:hypothetical protein